MAAKKHISALIRINSSVWSYAFKVPKEVGDAFVSGKDRRVMCTLNEQVTFPCALMGDGAGDYFINTNQEIRKKLGLDIGSTIRYSLEKDKSTYGMPMPEELGEILDMDEDANRYFHAFTLGKQRNLIFLVAKPKGSETRLRKAIVITEFLKDNNGKLDFKALNEAFKLANQK